MALLLRLYLAIDMEPIGQRLDNIKPLMTLTHTASLGSQRLESGQVMYHMDNIVRHKAH